jgi:hypothetical protein
MGRVVNIPDATALSLIEPWRRLIGLVVLVAVRDGASQVRFEPLRKGWRILEEMPDGSCKELVPAPAQAAVDRTIYTLIQPGWIARMISCLGATTMPLWFEVRLNSGLAVRCQVTENERNFRLALKSSPDAATRARELIQEFWRISDNGCGGVVGAPGVAAGRSNGD